VAEQIFIFGRGGHARVIAEIIELSEKFELSGYVDIGVENSEHQGVPLYAEQYFLDNFHGVNIVIGVGENYLRKIVFEKTKDLGLVFPNVIHPNATLSKTLVMDRGSVVMANVVVNASSRIGSFCGLNTASVLEHDCEIGDYVTLAPNSVVCANCQLGEGAYIGANASVIHSKTLSEWSVVASQAAVISDVAAFKMVAGVPAEVTKSVKRGQKIL